MASYATNTRVEITTVSTERVDITSMDADDLGLEKNSTQLANVALTNITATDDAQHGSPGLIGGLIGAVVLIPVIIVIFFHFYLKEKAKIKCDCVHGAIRNNCVKWCCSRDLRISAEAPSQISLTSICDSSFIKEDAKFDSMDAYDAEMAKFKVKILTPAEILKFKKRGGKKNKMNSNETLIQVLF